MSNSIEYHDSSFDDSQVSFLVPFGFFSCDHRRFRSNRFDVDISSLVTIIESAGFNHGVSHRSDEVVYFRVFFRWSSDNPPSYLRLFDDSIHPFVSSSLGPSPSVRALLDFVGSHSPRFSRLLFGFCFSLGSSHIFLAPSNRLSSYGEMASDFVLFLGGSPSLHQFYFL
jgi:hypothetical protein